MSINHYRKLLVYAVNELLTAGLVSLDDVKEVDECDSHVHFAEIAGRPSAILWRGIGHEELRIAIWWDFDRERYEGYWPQGQAHKYNSAGLLVPKNLRSQMVGATAAGWLERRDGKWLQGKGGEAILWRYLRTGSKELIDNLPTPAPLGYATSGRFMP